MNKSNDIKELIKELLSLTNRPEIDNSAISRMKDLICYLSDQRKKSSIPNEYLGYADFILYSAATRLRSFGYNRQNCFQTNDFCNEGIDFWKDEAISNYYRTHSGAVLDRFQKEVMDMFAESNHRLFLSAPTSFGKTFLLKEIIFSNYDRYSNIVIVLPTVALLMEVSQDLRDFFKAKKMTYSLYTSVYRDLELTEKNVFILTPERVLRLLALREEIKPDFVFFDEVYKIDEDIASSNEEDVSSKVDIDEHSAPDNKNRRKEHRAVAFRLALYLLMEKHPECYITGPFIEFKSAKSGLKQFVEKYQIKTMEVNFEPTLKNKIDYHGKKFKSTSSVTGEEIITTKASKNIDKLKFLTHKLGITSDEPALVYCLYPKNTEDYARQYCEDKCIVQDKDISIFIDHIEHNYNCRFNNSTRNSIDDWDFLYALKRGTGIHNGKFPRYFQREIMTLFNNNRMPILFCTSTIVEGVNTNAKTIILYNNPSGENEAGKKFLLLNINGRAGRYLRHFVGNIVYLGSKCSDIEKAANNISLDFKLFSSGVILDNIDLENVDYNDLSLRNRQLKSEIQLDRTLLPDSVFVQNRLIERMKQEKILKIIMTRIDEFRDIETVSVTNFIKQGYFQAILEIWSEAGEITPNQIDAIKYFAQNYAKNGYLGVLNYHFDTYNGEEIGRFVNDTYRKVFKYVKDTIEYQLPRIISLFESLINRAFELIGEPFVTPLDLSRIIRYFEIGATTLLGVDMIENGVPIITVRKIEEYSIKGETLNDQKESFKRIKNKIHFDEYEKKLIGMYIAE